jgi:hypothetical protein
MGKGGVRGVRPLAGESGEGGESERGCYPAALPLEGPQTILHWSFIPPAYSGQRE